MKSFDTYLNEIGEIGEVQEMHHSLAYVAGIPGARPFETVIFEDESVGQVFSLSRTHAEVLLLSGRSQSVGARVTRTNEQFQVNISKQMLGRTVDPLGVPVDGKALRAKGESRSIDVEPPGISARVPILEPFETGVTLVDLVIPLGRGQRELVIGDRKTGKTSFVLKSLINQARNGAVCIYGAIGKKRSEIKEMSNLFAKTGILKSTIIVAASASDSAGRLFLTPYTAMTIAEYFRDNGFHVYLVLDDLTNHAQVYREISLLAKRFPGRSSYPGDIFYIHAKLLERAGNFEKASITCMPIAESVEGDLSGYIQTNIMAMTDGHIFFDTELFDEGKRPAISPSLSVTRVGRQASSKIVRDLSRELSSFLVRDTRMRQFMKFGAELNEQVKQTLALGDRIQAFFQQPQNQPIPMSVNIVVFAALWAGAWRGAALNVMKTQISAVNNNYYADKAFRNAVDSLVGASQSFADIVNYMKENDGKVGQFVLEQKK